MKSLRHHALAKCYIRRKTYYEKHILFWNATNMDANSLRRKNKAAVNLKTGRFDNINSAVIISSVCKFIRAFLYLECMQVYTYSFVLPRIHC